MVPLAIETESEGKDYWFHWAATESGVSMVTGSFPGVMGICFSVKNF